MVTGTKPQPLIPIRGPVPTMIPLTSHAAGQVLQNCDACFGMSPSDTFDFEHGLCRRCSETLIDPDGGETDGES